MLIDPLLYDNTLSYMDMEMYWTKGSWDGTNNNYIMKMNTTSQHSDCLQLK